jgi:hypothetical protein
MDILTKLLLSERRRAERKAKDVEDIADSVADSTLDSQRLSTYMYVSFAWLQFAYDNPDMTAEEIASAAADGFAVEV